MNRDKNRRVRLDAPILLLCTLLTLVGCQRQPQPERAKNARAVMGTFAEVTAYAVDRETAQRAVDAAYARLDDVNRLMSDYIADSEIGRLNSTPAGQPLVVSPETFHCIQQALTVARQTGGAFDPTCRPLIELWRKAAKDNRLPGEEELAATLQRTGWTKIKLDPAKRTVTLTAESMQIDLGGIAKGYALDLAAAALVKAGATSGLVNVGGDVVAIGTRPGGQPWVIGIQDPDGANQTYSGTLGLTDIAVATSGVQQRFFQIGDRRYSHIIDPRTGRPAEQAPSVTVIAPDGLTADAWATVFSVLTVAEGQALLATDAAPGVEVLWQISGADQPTTAETPGFARYRRE